MVLHPQEAQAELRAKQTPTTGLLLRDFLIMTIIGIYGR